MSKYDALLDNQERKKMELELSQYKRSTIEEFQKVFPLKLHYDPPGTPEGGQWGKHNYYQQNIIPKEGGRKNIINVTMLWDDPYGSFWARWNKFKKLKVFL